MVSLRPAELGYHKQAVARIAQAEKEAPEKVCQMLVFGLSPGILHKPQCLLPVALRLRLSYLVNEVWAFFLNT